MVRISEFQQKVIFFIGVLFFTAVSVPLSVLSYLQTISTKVPSGGLYDATFKMPFSYLFLSSLAALALGLLLGKLWLLLLNRLPQKIPNDEKCAGTLDGKQKWIVRFGYILLFLPALCILFAPAAALLYDFVQMTGMLILLVLWWGALAFFLIWLHRNPPDRKQHVEIVQTRRRIFVLLLLVLLVCTFAGFFIRFFPLSHSISWMMSSGVIKPVVEQSTSDMAHFLTAMSCFPYAIHPILIFAGAFAIHYLKLPQS